METSVFDKNKYELVELDNGIKLVLIEDSTKNSYFHIRVSTGYINAPEIGLPHFMEHCFFLGSKNDPLAGERIRDKSIHYNGSTYTDYTDYYFVCNPSIFYELFNCMIDCITDPLFDEVKMKKEINAIHNEFLGTLYNSLFHLFALINKLFYNLLNKFEAL